MVIFSLSGEEEFNAGLALEFPLSSGDLYDVDEYFAQKVAEASSTASTLRKFEVKRQCATEGRAAVDWHMPDRFSQEGMPELNYIIN